MKKWSMIILFLAACIAFTGCKKDGEQTGEPSTEPTGAIALASSDNPASYAVPHNPEVRLDTPLEEVVDEEKLSSELFDGVQVFEGPEAVEIEGVLLGTVSYTFRDNRIASILYNGGHAEEADFQKLVSHFTSLYGAPYMGNQQYLWRTPLDGVKQYELSLRYMDSEGKYLVSLQLYSI